MKNLLFILLLFFTSCSILNFGNKQSVKKVFTIDSILNKQQKYDDLQYKFMLKYTDNSSSYNIFGKFLNIRDSIIYMNFTAAFGINVARLYVSPDTALLYLPIQNELYVGGQDLFLKKYNVALDFNSLQAILTAQIFSYPYFVSLNDYKFTQDTVLHLDNVIYNKRNSKVIDVIHNFTFDKEYNISSLFIEDYVLNKNLYVDYQEYNDIDSSYRFPSFSNMKIVDFDTTNVSIKYKNIKFNENIKIDFQIPNNAKVIDL